MIPNLLRRLLRRRPNIERPEFPSIASKPGEPIPALPDEYLTWPGKDEGKPKPAIIFLVRNKAER